MSSIEENSVEIVDVPIENQRNEKWSDLRRTKSLKDTQPRKARLCSVEELVDELVERKKKSSTGSTGYQSYLDTGKKSVKK